MSKWFRSNPYLGCMYEITEKEALKKINSKFWTAPWDDYWQKFYENVWYNIRDPERDWIFKEVEDGNEDKRNDY